MAKRKTRKRKVSLSGSKEYHVAGIQRAVYDYERGANDAKIHAEKGNCQAAVSAFVRTNYALGKMDAHAAAAGKRALETIKQRKMLIVARNAIKNACAFDLS